MKPRDQEGIRSQIESIEKLYHHHTAEASSNPMFVSLCLAFIERVTGPQHQYFIQAIKIADRFGLDHQFGVNQIFGVVQALKHDVELGFLENVREIIHAEVFSDLIEMADYLLGECYKDAAAVMLGGVIESHLRKLAEAEGIELTEDVRGMTRPKRADKLNAELAKHAYGLLEQKQITAWLDLRNKAAHAHYREYDEQQVKLFSEGLKAFMLKYPA